jgi:hypothetical protein
VSRSCCVEAWVAAALASMSAVAATADTATEQLVGAVEAVVFVCTPIDAKSAKAGLERLESARAQRPLDLAAVRQTPAYKAVYNAEVNRLLLLPAKERLAACKSAW